MDTSRVSSAPAPGASRPDAPIITPVMPLPRRVSEVRSPLDAFQGVSYARNIDRLERSAEELSQGGSDIGEEIRKMSRQNSIQSSHKGEISVARVGSGRSRTSSYANPSIVDVNSNARWGGYSPGEFITSPTGSVQSGSSRTHASMNRAASGTQSSRLAQMVEPLQEGRPLDSPLAPSSASLYSQEQHMSRQASQSSFGRRYDQIAGQIEEHLQAIPHTPSPDKDYNQAQHDDDDHHALDVYDTPDRPHSTDTFQEAQIAFKDFDGVHFDPDSEEFVELDDHGHEIRRVSARTSSGSLMDVASMLRTPRAEGYGQPRPDSMAIPPPRDSMVYYPAPVPRMLNLPKRLSQLPAAHAQAKRRSEMLSELPAGARQSAPWIAPMTFSDDGTRSQPDVKSQRSASGSASQHEQPRGMLNERMSIANAHNMPAQLRASMFFEHQPISHDVEVKSESAVATLDSILKASTNAPVSAFTHHPYAGDVRKTVYAPERPHQRKSTATTLNSTGDKEKEKKVKKRRSSSIGNFFRRNSTTIDGELREEPGSRPASRGSMLDLNDEGNKLRKRRSHMSLGANSLGDNLDRTECMSTGFPEDDTEPDRRRQTMMSGGLIDQAANASPHEDREEGGSRPMSMMTSSKVLTDAQQIDEDFKELEAEEDIELEDDPIFAQPTTLLAELQVRKAQLKSRNRTAATAFPEGMHSTLLQLDAVEQINAKKRQKQRVALAWEDPSLRAEEDARRDEVDEDVPLGVLFPGKDGLINRKRGDGRDWSRPLGLMERREMEDNEPLANRRTRLNPRLAPLKTAGATMSQMHLAGQPDADQMAKEAEDEHEGETLGQRLRRLRTKDALDSAISNVAPKDGERPDSTFSADVLDQFPELNIKDEAKEQGKEQGASPGSKKEAGAEEEETLGQRRARLQREREVSGEQAPTRPPLRQSHSMANLLSANPIGQRAIGKNQDPAHGTLLHTASQQQVRARQDLLTQNLRSASYGPSKPLVDARPNTGVDVSGGLLGGERSRPANGAFGGGQYNAGGYNMAPMDRASMMDALNTRREITTGLVGAQRSRPANGAFAGGTYSSVMGGLPNSMSTPMLNNNPYFASPTAGMGFGQMQMQMQPQQMHAQAYYALTGGGPQMSTYNPMMTNPMGTGTYGHGLQQQMNMNMGMDGANMDNSQRSAIDRWRMGIA